jgi:transglutaminase/protease-like cytokinesis protein 3
MKVIKDRYRARHPEVAKALYELNKERILTNIRARRKLHPQKRTYTRQQKERIRQCGKAWYQKNKQRLKELRRLNPAGYVSQGLRRRALKNAAHARNAISQNTTRLRELG